MTTFDIHRFMERAEWMDLAECAGAPADIFYPDVFTAEKFAQARAEAKSICRRCDVQAECLAFAMNNGESEGVWGGLDEHERRRLADVPVRARSIPAAIPPPIDHGSKSGYQAHHRRGEEPCRECAEAHAINQQFIRASRARSVTA